VSCATVSHSHIYGLLFKLLWPLCRGDAFYEPSFFFWEEVVDKLNENPTIVISSPAHLSRLPLIAERDRLAWGQARIFSSGSLLESEIANKLLTICGHAPIEVYGSTETGGIATREQTGGAATPWKTLPGISIRIENGLLAVRSNRLPDATEWFLSEDRALAEAPATFQLLGRADRTAKIFEKRVSLDEMEQRLSEHPAVVAARALFLPMEHGSGRDSLGAVLQLSEAGRQILARQGLAGLLTQLRKHLLHWFDSVTIPRRWRMVENWPTDALGKTSIEDLAQLFRPAKRPTCPIVLERTRRDSGCLVHLRVPDDLAYFQGHFPELPVVPGVCQLKWVVEEIEHFSGKPQVISTIDALKFHELLVPGEDLFLDFGFDSQLSKWSFRLYRGEKKISSGRLQCAP
jgi:acyl-coenzyme A synthetase/AMP-(fatty) acid ligase/3-hydroxymyristoyl/3-hydroxydecanoyl-(acyl carrier protein) dehydratase